MEAGLHVLCQALAATRGKAIEQNVRSRTKEGKQNKGMGAERATLRELQTCTGISYRLGLSSDLGAIRHPKGQSGISRNT